jgi:CubicO group peptidase (beta-lactamase class C family)
MKAIQVLAVGFAAQLVSACATAPVHSGSSTGRLDAIFDAAFTHYRLPGLALGVVQDGEAMYRRTAGETVAGSGQHITPDSLFKIASNSKARQLPCSLVSSIKASCAGTTVSSVICRNSR